MIDYRIRVLLDSFKIETIENILREMKEDDFKPYLFMTQKDLEHYLDLRKGQICLSSNI